MSLRGYYHNIETIEYMLENWNTKEDLDVNDYIDYKKKDKLNKTHIKVMKSDLNNINRKVKMRNRLRKKLEDKNKNE